MVLSSYQSIKIDKKQSDCLLSSCIKIKEERVSRHLTVPRQVCFELNLDIINRIEEIKQECGKLYLKPEQLIDLRYYSLINSPVVDDYSSDRFPLVFASNYLLPCSQFPTIVVRGTINLEGEILQEIQQDLWRNRQLLPKVIEAHHWLTKEILKQLPLENKSNSKIILWAVWIPMAIILAWSIWYFITLSFVFKVAITLTFSILLNILIKYVIKYHLRQWVLNQLICGKLSNQTNKRQIGFNLLSLLTID